MRVFRASSSFGIHGFVGSEARDGQPVSSPMGGRKCPPWGAGWEQRKDVRAEL